jgi:hypothetical protein
MPASLTDARRWTRDGTGPDGSRHRGAAAAGALILADGKPAPVLPPWL